MEPHIFTLNNGIRCMHIRGNSPVCYIAITVNAGTRDELSNQHGVAHLSEHMLFKGTLNHTPFQLNRLLENRGAEVNAYTTKEETVLHATCIRQDYQKMFRLLAEMFFKSRYMEKDINSEKEVIYDEISSYKDNPAELIFDEFENELYAGSTLGRNILGDKKHLKNIHRSHITEFTSSRYNTDEIIVSSYGNISNKDFSIIMNRIFGNIPQNLRSFSRISPNSSPKFNITKNKNTYQTHYIFGGIAPSIHDEDRIKTTMVANMLGGPFSISLLNQSLREKHSLTYNVECSYTAYSDSGLLVIYFGCEPEKTALSIEESIKTINNLKSEPLNDKKLRTFKNQLIGSLKIANENPEAKMLALARTLMIFGTISTEKTIYQKIENISSKDILEVANKIFYTGNLSSITYK